MTFKYTKELIFFLREKLNLRMLPESTIKGIRCTKELLNDIPFPEFDDTSPEEVANALLTGYSVTNPRNIIYGFIVTRLGYGFSEPYNSFDEWVEKYAERVRSGIDDKKECERIMDAVNKSQTPFKSIEKK